MPSENSTLPEELDSDGVPSVPYCYLDPNQLFQEDLELYRPGHFHPVHVKDIIRPDSASSALRSRDAPRGYRILHKLGAGGEASVWLAQELDNLNRAVSLKIYSARCRSAGEREARALKACMASPDTPGSKHIVKLLDEFTISGPNGTHNVHVTEVVMPLTSCAVPASWKKKVVQELVRGLAHVHHRGVVHGDIHMGNIGFAMPLQFDEKDIAVTMRILSLYDVTMILPGNPAQDSSSLPDYLLSPCDLFAAFEEYGGLKVRQDARLYDFGNARRVVEEDSPVDVRWACPPPEAAFAYHACGGRAVLPTMASDIWCLGALIVRLFTGESVLRDTTLECLVDQAKLDGVIPTAWRKYWDTVEYLRNQRKHVTRKKADIEWNHRRDRFMQRNPHVDVAEANLLISLLRRMLKANPDARPSAGEVLAHPWFADGLAQTSRKPVKRRSG